MIAKIILKELNFHSYSHKNNMEREKNTPLHSSQFNYVAKVYRKIPISAHHFSQLLICSVTRTVTIEMYYAGLQGSPKLTARVTPVVTKNSILSLSIHSFLKFTLWMHFRLKGVIKREGERERKKDPCDPLESNQANDCIPFSLLQE